MFREISNPEATKPEQVIKRWIEPEQPQAPDRECRRHGRSRKQAIYDRGRYHPEHCDASHCPARMTIQPIMIIPAPHTVKAMSQIGQYSRATVSLT